MVPNELYDPEFGIISTRHIFIYFLSYDELIKFLFNIFYLNLMEIVDNKIMLKNKHIIIY